MANIPGDFRTSDTITLAAIQAVTGTRIWVESTACFYTAVPSFAASGTAVLGGNGVSWEPDTLTAFEGRRTLGNGKPTRSSVLTIFASGHGFVNNSGGSADLNDTTDFILGAQAVRATTDGAATAKTIKKTAFTAVNASATIPVVALKIDSHDQLAGVQLYLGDTNLANYYKWEMKSSSSQKWLTAGDWCVKTLSWGAAQITGTPNKSNIVDAQFRLIDYGAGATTAHFNLIGFMPNPTKYTNGVVTFSFDDGYQSQYTAARAKLDQYGFPATAFIVVSYLGSSGRLTLAQLQALRDHSGWEVAPHATSGTIHGNRLTTLTEEQLEAEFTELRAWFSANGFEPNVFAYPGGEYNSAVLKKAQRHFIGARTIFQFPETLPPADNSKIRTNAYMSSSTLLATVQTAIDQAYTNKEWLHIVAHNIIDTPVQSTDVATATFNSIVDYVASKGIAVATMGDVLRNTP